jgi:hypothetical protein
MFILAKSGSFGFANRSPMRLGKQMCLNVLLAFYYYRSFYSLSLSFSIGDNVPHIPEEPNEVNEML